MVGVVRGCLCGVALLVLGCGPSAGGDGGATEPAGSTGMTGAGTPTTSAPAGSTTTVEPTTEVGASTTAAVGSTTVGIEPTGSGTSTGAAAESSEGEESGTPPCNQLMATLQPVATNLVLVLDKSTYMDHTWDHDGDANTPAVTRWSSLHAAVQAVALANEGVINFGAGLYPAVAATDAYTIAACPVSGAIEVPVAAMNAMNLVAGIPAADSGDLHGAVPAAAAMTSALDHLRALDPEVPRAAVFVASNAANCAAEAMTNPQRFEQYDPAVHTVVAEGFMSDGIPTYVVGIEAANAVTNVVQDGVPDGINPFMKLGELAVEGGRPKADPNEPFYDVGDQGELETALEQIVDDARSCVLLLETEAVVPDFAEVLIQGEEVPRVMDCSSEDGWVYTHPDGPYDGIALCGAACAALKLAGEADVRLFCIGE